MKILPEHYTHMRDAIAAVYTPEKDVNHRAYIVKQGKSKDVERRLRHDWKWEAGLSQFICDVIYEYANDDHIDTALKVIMKELRG